MDRYAGPPDDELVEDAVRVPVGFGKTRRAVLERLGSRRSSVSGSPSRSVMSLTGMKKHIRLGEAELVATGKGGRARRCSLAPTAFEGIVARLQRLDRSAQIVEGTKGDR